MIAGRHGVSAATLKPHPHAEGDPAEEPYCIGRQVSPHVREKPGMSGRRYV